MQHAAKSDSDQHPSTRIKQYQLCFRGLEISSMKHTSSLGFELMTVVSCACCPLCYSYFGPSKKLKTEQLALCYCLCCVTNNKHHINQIHATYQEVVGSNPTAPNPIELKRSSVIMHILAFWPLMN